MTIMKLVMPALVISALFAVGCAVPVQHTVHADAHGQRWVPLSSTDNIVPDLVDSALRAGCDVYHFDHEGTLAEARCRGDRLLVAQIGARLNYQCMELASSPTCEEAMERLKPSRAPYRF